MFAYFNCMSKARERARPSAGAQAIQDGLKLGKILRSPAPARPCLCGAEKQSGHIVCTDCWKAAPQSARSHFRSLSTRRHGARELKEFALTQKKETHDRTN